MTGFQNNLFKPITQLPSAQLPLAGTELVPVVQQGQTRTAPASAFSSASSALALPAYITVGSVPSSLAGARQLNPQSGIQMTDHGSGQLLDVTLQGRALSLHQATGAGFFVENPDGTIRKSSLSANPLNMSVSNPTGSGSDPVFAIRPDPQFTGSGGIIVPPGPTANRPATPGTGRLRYNTDTDAFEYWAAGAGVWKTFVFSSSGLLYIYVGGVQVAFDPGIDFESDDSNVAITGSNNPVSGIARIGFSLSSSLNFSGKTVSGGTFVNSTLSGPTLINSTGSGGTFVAPTLSNATINNSRTNNPTMSGGSFLSPTISGGTILGASTFSGGTVNNATINGSTHSGGSFLSPTISGATILGASTLSGATILGASTFSGGTVTGSTLVAITFNGQSILTGASISGGTLIGQTLSGATANNATINGSTHSGGSFLSPTISGATILGSSTFSGGTVNNATINGATASGGSFLSLTISGATILGASTFSGGAVNNATVNGSTHSGGSFLSPTISGATILGASTFSGGTATGVTIFNSTVSGSANGIAGYAISGTFSSAQRGTWSSLGRTSGGIALDFGNWQYFTMTAVGNLVINLPNGVTSGQGGVLEVYWQGTGTNTWTFSAGAKSAFVGKTAPVATGTSGSRDMLTYMTTMSGDIIWNSLLNLG